MLARFIFCFQCVRCDHATRLPMASQREKSSLSRATTIVSYSHGLAEAQSFCTCVFSLAKKVAKY